MGKVEGVGGIPAIATVCVETARGSLGARSPSKIHRSNPDDYDLETGSLKA